MPEWEKELGSLQKCGNLTILPVLLNIFNFSSSPRASYSGTTKNLRYDICCTVLCSIEDKEMKVPSTSQQEHWLKAQWSNSHGPTLDQMTLTQTNLLFCFPHKIDQMKQLSCMIMQKFLEIFLLRFDKEVVDSSQSPCLQWLVLTHIIYTVILKPSLTCTLFVSSSFNGTEKLPMSPWVSHMSRKLEVCPVKTP